MWLRFRINHNCCIQRFAALGLCGQSAEDPPLRTSEHLLQSLGLQLLLLASCSPRVEKRWGTHLFLGAHLFLEQMKVDKANSKGPHSKP